MPDPPPDDAVKTSASSLATKIRQAFSGGPARERFTRLSDLANAFFGGGRTNEADADDWRSVDPDSVVRDGDLVGLLIFMDGPTWRHYLPIWLTIAATRGAQLQDFVSVVITTLDPEAIVLADDTSRFLERTSILTDAQRDTIADVLGAFALFPWIRANDKSVGQVKRLVTLWRQGNMA